MSVTLNELYSQVWARFGPSVNPYDFYLAVNEAIDELNSKNFMNEAEYDLTIDTVGVGDLAALSENVIKVKRVRNHLGYGLIRKETGGEYVENYADPGERVYEHIGDEIRVKLPLSNNSFTSDKIQFITDHTVKYTGATDNFWLNNLVVPGMEMTISGSGEAANNATYTVSSIVDEDAADSSLRGNHTGSDAAIKLIDSGQAWSVNALVGKTITNLGSFGTGVIVSNDATSIYAVLSVSYFEGGYWNNGDPYQINTALGNVLYVSELTIVSEAAGADITFAIAEYLYKITGIFSLPKFATFTPTTEIAIEDSYRTAIILKAIIILIGRGKIRPDILEITLADYNQELAALVSYQQNRKE